MGILGAIVKAATVKAVAKAAEGAVESIATQAGKAVVAKVDAKKEAEKAARQEQREIRREDREVKREIRKEERAYQKELLKENVPCLFVPKSANDFIGCDYEEVIKELQAYGFEDFHLHEKKDLSNNWFSRSDHHRITEITIEGMDDFKKRTAFRMGARVVITYHEYK